ncbi:O-acetyl-ADP-ribose deacetylase [Chromobacterium amazonense]|uniref:O-acetyl-ADP-ribose deacetylase n=1 Tax=Chromobacterium amazonense TaxID=1382803 RepID=UPI0031F667C5
MDALLRCTQADITQMEVDAIVNAANSGLLGGGGVDGAIHRAAGPALLEACRALGGCPTGEARLTPGFNLKAAYVIHTVGPVWQGGGHGEAALLAACYRNSLELARLHEARSIAFPAISCGVYGYPLEAACELAVRELRSWLAERPHALREVWLVAFDTRALDAYRRALS